ncbi:MAG: M48 family metalloprotease [Firmicutes bacterium]|nr:M48 family metalloprotease [Bacillota bacterium]
MRRWLAVFLSIGLVRPVSVAQASPQQAATQAPALAELLEKPYLWLFENAAELNLPAATLQEHRRKLEREKRQEQQQLEQQRRRLEQEIERAQQALHQLNRQSTDAESEKRRHDLHCHIQELRRQVGDLELALRQGVDVKYDNLFAKLRLLQEWPTAQRQLLSRIQSGQASARKFGDFRDIGFRNGTFQNQADDIARGREAIEELRRNGILPPEVEDESVVRYVRTLAQRLAQNSDLQVPLQVTVLKSEEINAFALPGGFLFVNTGLILKAETESELAGVLAHEIAHVAARHGHRLMKRATIASLIYQAAQVAALVLTGGVASIGTAYALQYGFYGLGLFLSLELLGVSRDYEIEADILGTQYLWKAGYNTRGFINFFDRMTLEKGYATGLSWFRTHPPFYERMAVTYSEILYLPHPEQAADDTSEFQRIKGQLAQILLEMEKKDRDAPTLQKVYECRDREDHSHALRHP